MSGFSGVLSLPVPGGMVRVKAILEHRQTNDETALVRRVKRGDELAFRVIVERYQSKVLSIIYGILRNR
ncbi:MAG: RNA polymerase sigma factor, partial [Acidobacteria bacterium]|nr:RNA polymerase sigma factor [Acidobacteriota bacterium]